MVEGHTYQDGTRGLYKGDSGKYYPHIPENLNSAVFFAITCEFYG